MSPCQERRKWTKAEDTVLRKEVSTQRQSNSFVDWAAVSAKLPNRTNKDCRKRWLKSGNNCRKGTWTKDEDRQLQEAFERHGSKWTQIAQEIGSRTADQCAKRWQYSLDPTIDRSEWTSGEDDALYSAVSEGGRNWSYIAQTTLPGRSATHLKNRYELICRRRHDQTPSPQEETDFHDSGLELSDISSTIDSATPPSLDQDFPLDLTGIGSYSLANSSATDSHTTFDNTMGGQASSDTELQLPTASPPDGMGLDLSSENSFDSIFDEFLIDQYNSQPLWGGSGHDPMGLQNHSYPSGDVGEFDQFDCVFNSSSGTVSGSSYPADMKSRSTNCTFALEETNSDALRSVCDLLLEKGIRFDMRISYKDD